MLITDVMVKIIISLLKLLTKMQPYLMLIVPAMASPLSIIECVHPSIPVITLLSLIGRLYQSSNSEVKERVFSVKSRMQKKQGDNMNGFKMMEL